MSEVYISLVFAMAISSASGLGTAILLVIVILGIGIYFIPTIVAFTRGVTNAGSVFVINLLLGWSIIGWAIALAMAVKTNMTQVHVVTTNVNTSPSPRSSRTYPPPPATSPPKSLMSVETVKSNNGCVECNELMNAGAKFCPQCGAEVSQLVTIDSVGPDDQRSVSKWCDRCEVEIDSNAKFCPECGTPAEEVDIWRYTDCGGDIGLEDKFCPSCGQSC